MSDWVVVGGSHKRKKKKKRTSPRVDNNPTYRIRVSEDIHQLLRSTIDVSWTPEDIQDALQYASLKDIWYALDFTLVGKVKKSSKKSKWKAV